MLTWNDETPSLKTTPPAGVGQASNAHGVRAATGVFGDIALPTPGLTQSPTLSAVAEQLRVNVADKRIINGKTDVNQLVPFK